MTKPPNHAMDDVEEIVRRLSKRDRRALRNAKPHPKATLPDSLFVNSRQAELYKLRLATIVMGGVMLNEFGLRVREYLERQNNVG